LEAFGGLIGPSNGRSIKEARPKTDRKVEVKRNWRLTAATGQKKTGL
jgi:hypothetical protein